MRAIRRHHYYRLKTYRKARDYYGKADSTFKMEAELLDFRSAVQATTACGCSCWMCGNPRKFFNKPTRKEEVFLLNFQEQIIDSNF
jgi:hypothetical protein